MEKKIFDRKAAAEFFHTPGHTKTDFRDRFGASKTAIAFFDMMIRRRENARPARAMHAIWRDTKIAPKLAKIAAAMPHSGHSMGSEQTAIVFAGETRIAEVSDARSCDEYAHSCRFRAVHGAMYLRLSFSEFKKIEILGGVITILGGYVSAGIRRCRWVSRRGEKQNARCIWVSGFYISETGYHTIDLGFAEAQKKVGIANSRKTRKRINALKNFRAPLSKIEYPYTDIQPILSAIKKEIKTPDINFLYFVRKFQKKIHSKSENYEAYTTDMNRILNLGMEIMAEERIGNCEFKINFQDSIKAHNCIPGTQAFIEKHNLDATKSYPLSEIWNIADSSEKMYVRRIYTHCIIDR